VRYMLIHCVDAEREGHSDPSAEIETSLAKWIAETTASGALIDGSRLEGVEQATTVRIRDGRPLVTDGPFAETKELIAGYDILECAHLDEALEIALRHPNASLGTIEIRPLVKE
jgi:hypothetical protein